VLLNNLLPLWPQIVCEATVAFTITQRLHDHPLLVNGAAIGNGGGITVTLGIIVSDELGIGAAPSAAVDAEVPASVALLDAYKCATRDDVELFVSHFDWL